MMKGATSRFDANTRRGRDALRGAAFEFLAVSASMFS
jgi:hypothetical protein